MSLNEVPQLSFFRTPVEPEDFAPLEPIVSTTTLNAAPEEARLTLFRGSDDMGRYVSSPFVTKVEFRLRVSDVDYALAAGAPWLGPKGKIPYLHLQPEILNGEKPETVKLGDSTLIIQHLVGEGTLKDLNSSLSPAHKAQDLALRSLLEDKLYFYHMRECWFDNFYEQRDQALWSIPAPIRYFVGNSVYGKVSKTLYGQGTGRLTSAEVDQFRHEIWHSFDDILQEVRESPEVRGRDSMQPFWLLGGELPTEADITLYSFIASIHSAPSCPGSQKLLRSLPAIMDYAGRIHNVYFPDYARWAEEVTSNSKL